MAHYYIEDITVDPMRENRIEPVRSIQFDRLSTTVYINIDEPQDKKLVRASVQISKQDMDYLCKWWNEKEKPKMSISSHLWMIRNDKRHKGDSPDECEFCKETEKAPSPENA